MEKVAKVAYCTLIRDAVDTGLCAAEEEQHFDLQCMLGVDSLAFN